MIAELPSMTKLIGPQKDRQTPCHSQKLHTKGWFGHVEKAHETSG